MNELMRSITHRCKNECSSPLATAGKILKYRVGTFLISVVAEEHNAMYFLICSGVCDSIHAAK